MGVVSSVRQEGEERGGRKMGTRLTSCTAEVILMVHRRVLVLI